MRTLPSNLQTHLAAEGVTAALCCRLQRVADGVMLGFTDWDRDLVVELETYEAETALDASALAAQLGSGVDQFDVMGLLRSDALKEEDLHAGLWDGAGFRFFLVNPFTDPVTETATLLTGDLGEVEWSDGRFRVEARGLMARLGQQVGDLVTPTCNVKRFGDARCKKDLTALRHTRTVSAVTSATVLRFGADTVATGFYNFGRVQFTTGANAGLEREVKEHTHDSGATEAVLTLQEAFPFAVQAGDTATLEEGCDRLWETCQRHENWINFRGFPHLPSSDRVTQRGTR